MKIKIYWGREFYYYVTYTTQNTKSLSAPLYHTKILKSKDKREDPKDWILKQQKKNPNIRYTLIYYERITKGEYKEQLKKG